MSQSSNAIPTIRRTSTDGRNKREIRPPSMYEPPAIELGHSKPKRKSTSGLQGEQFRFCREVVREVTKKSYESFTFPFLQPVGTA